MKDKTHRKLVLTKETIRDMNEKDLRKVAGGRDLKEDLTLGACWLPTKCGSGLNCW